MLCKRQAQSQLVAPLRHLKAHAKLLTKDLALWVFMLQCYAEMNNQHETGINKLKPQTPHRRATCTTLDLTLNPFFYPPLDLDIYHSYTLGWPVLGMLETQRMVELSQCMWRGHLTLWEFFCLKGAGTLCGRCILSLEILVAALLQSAAFNSISCSYPVDGAPVGAGSLWPCQRT